ncbi:MAG: priA [Gammaproteobacteria bacterium]|jgi:primosomal protein N' (replication factor Y)|nr:priA [Gammaproteobacteria bacterium]
MITSVLRVYVPGPFWEPLDYLMPTTWTESPCVGARVTVPLRNREIVGIVANITHESHTPAHKLKWALSILDQEPLFDEIYLEFLKWLSEYYHAPLGEVLHMALPVFLRKGKLLPEKNIQAVSSDEEKNEKPLTLTPDQELAVRQILSSQDIFQTFLLHGVTGSGKTEVYLQVIENIVRQGKQALVLVPEIGLTPQTLSRFSKRFGSQVIALHSELSEKKRLLAWLAARDGRAKVIVGTRSAILAPFKELGVIVIDEEHDLSFKQQDGIRYSARDAAVVRASQMNIPIVLGSATPSFETWVNAEKGKYQRIDLAQRVGGASLPSWRLIDLRKKYVEAGLSNELLTAIAENLAAKQQVLLFLNRRGYAPAWICHQCGWSPDCPHCDIKLTYHAHPPKLVCHICAKTQKVQYACKECGSKMAPLGVGTQRLEEALQQHFPDIPIIRIDRDSTARKNSFEKILAQVHEGHPQILLGTQMIAKGHHFPQVTMVGVLNPDGGLYSADFRAPEHLAQLMLQVAGRAGREQQPGKVYIQTYWPEHALWQDIAKPDGYALFVNDMLKQRMLAQLPPYRFIALLQAEAKEAKAAETFLKEMLLKAKNIGISDVSMLGPVAALQAKRAGYYRSQILLVSENRASLQRLLKVWIPQVSSDPLSRKFRWHLDVDPVEVL